MLNGFIIINFIVKSIKKMFVKTRKIMYEAYFKVFDIILLFTGMDRM